MSVHFSATKRLPRTSLATPAGRGSVRTMRLTVILGLSTLLFLLWLAWRYVGATSTFDRLPGGILELLNLLTLSVALTLGLVWALLLYQVWRQGYGQSGRIHSVAQLQALSPAQFEQFAAELFRARGYDVDVRGRSGDLGVDLEIVNAQGKRAIAQCKRYRSTVGPDVTRELYGTMIHERVSHAFLVTTAEISDGAREWAAGKPMTLIDGATLLDLANTSGVGVA